MINVLQLNRGIPIVQGFWHGRFFTKINEIRIKVNIVDNNFSDNNM